MSDTNQAQPAKTRYYAVHANADIDLHGWTDERIANHRQHDFSTQSYVHVVDRLIDCCAVCGQPTYAIRAGAGQFCPGPRNSLGYTVRTGAPQAPVAGGIVGSSSAQKSLQDMIEKYKAMPPDDCHTGTEGGGTVPKTEEAEKQAAPKKDVLIAESAKPTTGIDWDAFKNFGKGL